MKLRSLDSKGIIMRKLLNGSRREKICLRGLRITNAQTSLSIRAV